MVHLADIVAHTLQLGAAVQRPVPSLDAAAWDTLGIPASALAPTLEQVEQQFHDVLQTILPDRKPCPQ